MNEKLQLAIIKIIKEHKQKIVIDLDEKSYENDGYIFFDTELRGVKKNNRIYSSNY